MQAPPEADWQPDSLPEAAGEGLGGAVPEAEKEDASGEGVVHSDNESEFAEFFGEPDDPIGGSAEGADCPKASWASGGCHVDD